MRHFSRDNTSSGNITSGATMQGLNAKRNQVRRVSKASSLLINLFSFLFFFEQFLMSNQSFKYHFNFVHFTLNAPFIFETNSFSISEILIEKNLTLKNFLWCSSFDYLNFYIRVLSGCLAKFELWIQCLFLVFQGRQC